ncbi:MAG: tRNA (adenosine(37)-N6)-threonylcarbamoyltransferase complex ATPase subunit type 1 TsaE [Ruminococcaceae bacterium]|nr:tRNA (adenosine(37)-N6)-threonylcarbamoyltransferase complex ATPase subunit type 1 TsaE [Oscillospiraceae bacterium]
MQFISDSELQTEEYGRMLGLSVKCGDIICLNGNLGAGKTHFTKGIAKALGIGDVITSPTFTIVNEYRSNSILLLHFDLYRLESFDDLENIGFDEYMDQNAVSVIEWSEKIPELHTVYSSRIINVNILRCDDISPVRRIIKINGADLSV